jgi:hypothetical protein
MTNTELDTIWFQAQHDAIKAGEDFTRYRFAALVAAVEREAISDEYAARLQSDLENGVRRLNEAAASEFHKKYPQLASFNAWLNERENT